MCLNRCLMWGICIIWMWIFTVIILEGKISLSMKALWLEGSTSRSGSYTLPQISSVRFCQAGSYNCLKARTLISCKAASLFSLSNSIIYCLVFSKFRVMDDCQMSANGIIHMDTGPKVCRRIGTVFDDFIPFCEPFVIPYFLWFAYVSMAVLYCFFKNKREYCRTLEAV